jgi:orotidine-5'-phosphate decarboxylase
MTARAHLFDCTRGLIIAADVSQLDELSRLCEAAKQVPQVVAIKVGFMLGLRHGLPAVVKTVKKTCGLPVIYDHQKAATDIPAMGEPFATVCVDAGVQAAIFFPQAGPKTLEGFVRAAFTAGLTPIVGLTMTHPGYLESDGGFIRDTAPEQICKIAIDLGVRSFVLPGNKPDILKRFSQGPLAAAKPAEIMMPGIGTQGGSASAACTATQGHHALPIVGSSVYKAADPVAALQQLAKEIQP